MTKSREPGGNGHPQRGKPEKRFRIRLRRGPKQHLTPEQQRRIKNLRAFQQTLECIRIGLEEEGPRWATRVAQWKQRRWANTSMVFDPQGKNNSLIIEIFRPGRPSASITHAIIPKFKKSGELEKVVWSRRDHADPTLQRPKNLTTIDFLREIRNPKTPSWVETDYAKTSFLSAVGIALGRVHEEIRTIYNLKT